MVGKKVNKKAKKVHAAAAPANETIAVAIKAIVAGLMDKVMDRVLVSDPFVAEVHHAAKPLYAALVPDEIFKGSHFERRFVTPFGNVWERLAMVVAQKHHGKCEKGYTVHGTIGRERLRRIQEVLSRLEHPDVATKKRLKPNFSEELSYVCAGSGVLVPCDVTCDIFVENVSSGKRFAFELKGPLPNSDQTKVSKEKILKLMAMSPKVVDAAFYALVYNPYGKNRADYAWTFPARWFDMQNDSVILLGEDFWDMIGGRGTYRLFIAEINKLGRVYRERIYREFLGMEPPENISHNEMR